MVSDAALLAGDVNAVAQVELGRVDAEVDVGHERAEHDDAVAGFDVLRDLVVAHAAFVEAHVERMRFGDDAFAEHRGGHRDAGLLGQLHGLFLQAEAMDFDAQQGAPAAGRFRSVVTVSSTASASARVSLRSSGCL